MKFRNTTNGYVEEVSVAWLWCFLFGPFYFAVRGIWPHAIVLFILSAVIVSTLGAGSLIVGPIISLVYATYAESIVESHYLRAGWRHAD